MSLSPGHNLPLHLHGGLQLKYTPYDLPMLQPMSVRGESVTCRTGLLVSLSNSHGHVGIGDICPLPGLHAQNINDCTTELESIRHRLLHSLPDSISPADVLGFATHITDGLSAVTTNGIHLALLHFFSKVAGKELAAFVQDVFKQQLNLNAAPLHDTVFLNGVFPRQVLGNQSQDQDRSQSQFKQAVMSSRFDSLKLKVGANPDVVQDARQTENALHVAQDLNKTIRLDANRAWSPLQFQSFQNELRTIPTNLEFIEEPLCTWQQLLEYLCHRKTENCPLPIALDESLVDAHLSAISEMSRLAVALVLKPAVIGSVSRLISLVGLALRSGCRVVVSTCFESGLGTAWNTTIAAVCDSFMREKHAPQLPERHGLGTYTHLREDVLKWNYADSCVGDDGTTASVKACSALMDGITECKL